MEIILLQNDSDFMKGAFWEIRRRNHQFYLQRNRIRVSGSRIDEFYLEGFHGLQRFFNTTG